MQWLRSFSSQKEANRLLNVLARNVAIGLAHSERGLEKVKACLSVKREEIGTRNPSVPRLWGLFLDDSSWAKNYLNARELEAFMCGFLTGERRVLRELRKAIMNSSDIDTDHLVEAPEKKETWEDEH